MSSTTDWGTPPQSQEPEWGTPPPAQQQAATPAAAEAPDINETLDGGGVKSFSFDAPIGTTADGLIVEIPKGKQKIDFYSKQPLYWDANKLVETSRNAAGEALTPAWTYPIHIQTNLRTSEDDDGIRAIFFEYKKLAALKDARKVAGVDKVEVGGRLMVRYLSGGPKDPNPNATRNKVYGVKYFPPGSPEAAELVRAQPTVQLPPSAPPVQQPMAQPAQQSWGTGEEPPF
jgi:hypothetical protein